MHVRRDRTAADMEGADLGRRICEVRVEIESLAERIDTLARVCAGPTVSEQFSVVEGPFVGDAAAALETTRLWLERSHDMLTGPAQSLAQAHVAAGGLASTW